MFILKAVFSSKKDLPPTGFGSFGFIQCIRESYSNYDDDDDDICIGRSSPDSDENHEWYDISVPSIQSIGSLKVRIYKGIIGNNCHWASEEIMTYFCIKNSAIFDDKSVCELGSGLTCLAGLMVRLGYLNIITNFR